MGDGCCPPAVRGDRLLEEGREGLRADPGPGDPHEISDGEHLGCHDQPDPGAARTPDRREGQLRGDRVDQRLLETVLLPARRRPERGPGQRRIGA